MSRARKQPLKMGADGKPLPRDIPRPCCTASSTPDGYVDDAAAGSTSIGVSSQQTMSTMLLTGMNVKEDEEEETYSTDTEEGTTQTSYNTVNSKLIQSSLFSCSCRSY